MVGLAVEVCRWRAGLLRCVSGGPGCCDVSVAGRAVEVCRWRAGLLRCVGGGPGC